MRYNTQDWKGSFINDIIKDSNYSSYLELGVAFGESWKRIFCKNKVGVDNDHMVSQYFDGVICATTDEFFKTSKLKFDLIYIDASHEKNQAYKDFKNSYNSLNTGGIIIFHDINPREFGHTSPNSSGNIFEVWIDLCQNFKVYTYSDLAGDTCGIFIKKENLKLINFEVGEYDYRFFSENKDRFINDIKYEEIINKIRK